jgi:uncharacterized protein (DUF983 family)
MASLSALTRHDCPKCGPGVLFIGFTCLHCKAPLRRKVRGRNAAVFNGAVAKAAALEAGVEFKRQRASTPAPRKGFGKGIHGAGRA